MRQFILFHFPHNLCFLTKVLLYLFSDLITPGRANATMAHKQQSIEPDVPYPQQQQQGAFPSDLPPRAAPPPSGQSWKDRNCPGMRNCWSFSLSSYSLKDVDQGTRLRRICMIAILALRTVISVLSCISAAAAGYIAGLVIYAIVGVIGLWFIAWCLARIGDCTGERRVLGVLIVSSDEYA